MNLKGVTGATASSREFRGILTERDPSIAAPRGLYAVAFGPQLKKKPKELLLATPTFCGWGIRLTKSENRKTDYIINRPERSNYLKEKSVQLTSEGV